MATDVGTAVYEKFLPEAMAKGQFVTTPEPWVVGRGLSGIQDAVEACLKGVSGKKAIALLD